MSAGVGHVMAGVVFMMAGATANVASTVQSAVIGPVVNDWLRIVGSLLV